MGKFSLLKTVCIVLVFCAATAVGSPAQTLTTLVNFNGTDGSHPSCLIQASDGNFYGVAGLDFKMTPQGTLSTLSGGTSCLVQGSDGNFYGQTGGSPPMSWGTVFKMTPDGVMTTLHNFDGTDGIGGGGSMVQAADGSFYGTTLSGGLNDSGTVFKITLGGAFTSLYSFRGPTFLEPLMVQGADGNFYGTTQFGGSSFACGALGCGTVFKITPQGTLTTLYNFCSQANCADGSGPVGGLIQGADGNFYGTTWSGNPSCCGTVFKVTPAGTLITLYRFSGPDGAYPYAGLVQGTDGNFYGTTEYGSSNNCLDGCGTVFKIAPGGTLTTLHNFNGTDGFSAEAALVQAVDGSFYGTTYYGGTGCSGYGCGTVFNLSVGLAPFVETQPASGNTGAPVTILGTNLTGATGVTFNGTSAAFNVVSPSEITTNVPAGATTGPVQVMGTGSGTLTSNATFQITSPVQFVPVAPCRLLDTRPQYGGSGPIQGETFQTFNLPLLAQKNDCASLSGAAAYSLNVTVVPHGFLGYLTVWPTGEIMPYVSTLNSYDGRVKANAVIVPGGSNAVSVYATDTTDVILDINGYFIQSNESTLAFYPLPPCRVADTRDATDFAPGLGPPYLMGNMQRDFPVLQAVNNKVPCNIPNSAQAYSMNFTAVPHGFLGYLTVWPTGENQPLVSTLNAYTGTVTANAAIVPAGMNGGDINAFVTNDTDLVIDINGYFAPPGQGGLSLYPVVPCRVIDTRPPSGNGPFNGTLSPPVDPVNSPCAVPAASQADVFNATVVPTGVLGYLTLWPDGGNQPLVSTLNALDGIVTSNMAIVPAGNQGKIDAYADQNTSPTDLILDISSYFAP